MVLKVNGQFRKLFFDVKQKQYLQERFFSSKKRLLEKKDFGLYKIVKPTYVSDRLPVPSSIRVPPYALDYNFSEDIPKEPEIKTADQIHKMRKSCYLASFFLESISKYLQPGYTTDQIDKIIHTLCIETNAYPSPLGYKGFPKSICTSVNNVACHGIPDNRLLEDGDIINIDITVYADGYHGDCSATFPIGNVDEKGHNLILATQQCLHEAIAVCRDGEYFCSIGQVITDAAKKFGYNVVPCFAGHGIGRYFHGPPDIYHCYNDYPGKMRTGMTFTIEPVLTQGEPEIIVLEDGWTAVTADSARTAQFEHTILVTDAGAEILTQLPTST